MRRRVGAWLGILLLAGCGLRLGIGSQPAVEETSATPEEREDVVVAEGIVEPAYWSRLGFEAAGEVVDVLVHEGDIVATGDVLVRLHQLGFQLAVMQAKTDLEVAQAQLMVLKAGSQSEEIAAAEARLAAAEAAVEKAAAERNELISGVTDAEIAAAYAEIASADAQRKLAEGTYNDSADEELARYDLEAAEKALAAAQARLDELRAGPDPHQVRGAAAGVQAAAAERGAVQAQLDLLQAGPTEEEIAVAEVDVAQARVALEAARAALADTEVCAPFAGTVTAVDVEVGNAVTPAQVACILARLDQLQVRTKDLSELDVATIEPGQRVKVTVDALPEREFNGRVAKVALRADSFRGGAVYAVTVDLVDVGDAPLRWGMTAWVEFERP